MLNRFISFTLALVALFISVPVASGASDIPLLSWERGKEQNIVLGGYTNQSDWLIQLVSENQ